MVTTASRPIAKSAPPVLIRPARRRDLSACARVCLRALRDLSRRQGKPPPRLRPREFLPFLRHALATDPSGFHVAVSRGKVVCYAITILRDKTHFLAQFFALPGAQGRGIGKQVLTRAFELPRPPVDAARCLVASLDLRAQALYLKFGMSPRTIVYHMVGKPRVAPRVGAIALRQVGPTGRGSTRARAVAARFDRVLREARRDEDHRFWFSSSTGTRFFEARRGREIVGYILVRGNGAIGPGGVRHPHLSEALLSAALAKARGLSLEKVLVWIPGLNEGALRAAFAAGLKVDFLTVWMSSRNVGELASYIPSGGALF